MFGKLENPKNQGLQDLSVREFATFAPLIILAFWIGLYPSPFIRRLDTSVAHVIARVSPEYGQRNALFEPCPTTEELQAAAKTIAERPAFAQGASAGRPVSTTGGAQPNFLLPPCESGAAKPAEKKPQGQAPQGLR
jgi:NADH-quinone oxidoreductase subunit M